MGSLRKMLDETRNRSNELIDELVRRHTRIHIEYEDLVEWAIDQGHPENCPLNKPDEYYKRTGCDPSCVCGLGRHTGEEDGPQDDG